RPVPQGVRRARGAAAGRGRRGLRRTTAGTGLGRERRSVHQRGSDGRDDAAPQAARAADRRDRGRRRIPDRLARAARGGAPMSGWTLRTRLTVLYGGLFLLAGATLLVL